jgi:hypothetical protein
MQLAYARTVNRTGEYNRNCACPIIGCGYELLRFLRIGQFDALQVYTILGWVGFNRKHNRFLASCL